MTVAASCNLSEGVILGVDSAVTMPGKDGGVANVYENAEKLFPLGERPIGIAIFGLAVMGGRSLGSYLIEFETKDPNNVVSAGNSISDVVEELRSFFYQKYQSELVPSLERSLEKEFEEMDPNEIPSFGLVVGGFSHGQYLSEIWEILIPHNSQPNSATQKRSPGTFGTDWFAMKEPIKRYIKGADERMLNEIFTYLQNQCGLSLDDQEWQDILGIIEKHEYHITYDAMPLAEGVEHTRFLIELVINHHRFAVGAPVVGGKAQIGKVSYRGHEFEILKA